RVPRGVRAAGPLRLRRTRQGAAGSARRDPRLLLLRRFLRVAPRRRLCRPGAGAAGGRGHPVRRPRVPGAAGDDRRRAGALRPRQGGHDAEDARAVGPGGRLFVYTHAMESSALARFQRAVNRLARRLGQAGLIDYEREALRKSDHVNAIRSHEHFEALCAEAGLEVAERRYYNVVIKAVVEDLGLRLYEQARRKRARRTEAKGGRGGPESPPRSIASANSFRASVGGLGGPESPPSLIASANSFRASVKTGRLALAAARALTWLLKLDVVLFRGVRTGPCVGLLRPGGS